MEVVVTAGLLELYKSCKAPAKSSPPTNQHRFLQAAWPSCRPTNSVKALKGKYHIPWTCLPQTHLGVFRLCLWPVATNSSWLPWGGLPCLSSALWCQYPYNARGKRNHNIKTSYDILRPLQYASTHCKWWHPIFTRFSCWEICGVPEKQWC